MTKAYHTTRKFYVDIIASDGDKYLIYKHNNFILFEKACYFQRTSQRLRRTNKLLFSDKLLRGDFRTKGVPVHFEKHKCILELQKQIIKLNK